METQDWLAIIGIIIAVLTLLQAFFQVTWENSSNTLKRFLARRFLASRWLILIAIIIFLFSAGYLYSRVTRQKAEIISAYATQTAQAVEFNIPTGELEGVTATPTRIGYSFETGTQNWNTTEGAEKLAELDTTGTVAYSGNRSLQLITELDGTQEDVYQHTEATAYFNNAVPEGINIPGIYNLSGKEVSCFVYVPQGLVSPGEPQADILLFVKDDANRNQEGTAVAITAANADQWIRLSLNVGSSSGRDVDFDPTKINALGIRVRVKSNSSFSYTGPIYIDECSLK